MAILSLQPENMPEAVVLELAARGICALCGGAEGIEALAVAAHLGTRSVPGASILLPATGANPVLLSEAEAKRRLAGFGVEIPRGELAGSPEAAAVAAERIGFPVVLKMPGVAHKTEVGAVRVNLTTTSQVATAAALMGRGPFLIEQMVVGGVAELLVGVVSDPAHGHVLTLAAGGVLTELVGDAVSLLLPVTETDILGALARLRSAPLLAGYRGAAPADIGAIVAAVLAVQAFVAASPDLVHEVEVNPLICSPTAAIAVDALIRISQRAES